MRQKQSSFSTQNIPILGADAAGAVFRDTPHEARLAEIPPSHKRIYCYVGGIFTGDNTARSASILPIYRVYENAATAENRP